jgi:endonuclease YncB( thermonuclease family)
MEHALLFTLLTLSEPLFASALAGSGRVIDGDSLMVGQQEVRLFGIDAPELAARGPAARRQPVPTGAEPIERGSALVNGELGSGSNRPAVS